MKKKLLLAFIFLYGLSFSSSAQTLRKEKNGFIWYHKSVPVDPNNYRRGTYEYAYNQNKEQIFFGKCFDISFHCVDSSDPGQFIVKRPCKPAKGGTYSVGIYSRTGECILNPTLGYTGIDKRFTHDGRYYYITYQYVYGNSGYGLIDENGVELLKPIYKKIGQKISKDTPISGIVTVQKYDYSIYDADGLAKLDGTFIIEPQEGNRISASGNKLIWVETSEGKSILSTNGGTFFIKNAKDISPQSSDNGYFYKITMEDNRKGWLGHDGNWIIPLGTKISSLKKFIGPSNKIFYKVTQNSMNVYGIIDEHLNEIFPCEFEDIEYIGGELFKFRSGSFWGVVTIDSKVIVPTSRGYSSIGKYSSIQKTFTFTKPGYKGECNSLGKEIVKLSTKAQNSSSIKKSFFKLRETKFYKITHMEITIDHWLPFEAEIAFFNNSITFCFGDGNGNVDGVDFYDAEYSEKDGVSKYSLKGNLAQHGETGELLLEYSSKKDKILVTYKRTKSNGEILKHKFIMETIPYNTPILKRP